MNPDMYVGLALLCLVGTIRCYFERRNMTECYNGGVQCSRWGTCLFDTVESNFTCRCVPGFMGELCEEDRNECHSAPCKKRGVCHNSIGSFRCECVPGWRGSHCQTSDGSGESTCPTGYTGANCTDDFDECTQWAENPCEHGSICTNTPGNFSCSCATGWEGRICNEDINECNLTADVCHDHGHCTNIPGGHKCACRYPFTGPACNFYSTAAYTSMTSLQTLFTLPSLKASTPQLPSPNVTQPTLPALPANANWTVWTKWSNCDTTCGNGSSTRTRILVSRPIGMPQCISREREILHCTNNPCPVNGEWTVWSRWDHCSVNCGIGLERRNRNCSNPYPGPGGRSCFGDSTEDRPCFIKACSDGLWSDWTAWGTCSATCLGGIQKRTRACNNPAPSQFGHDCVGNSEDMKQCGNRPCQDGLWSGWTTWGACSASCLGGIQKRTRTCDNPAPSLFGRDCVGNSEDIKQCGNHPCQGVQSYPTIAFRASKVSSLSPTFGQTLIYMSTEINQGGGYDSNTGVFTAPAPGMYMFVVQTCADAHHDFSLSIFKDGHVETSTELYFADGYTCYTTNALVSMMTGNRVWVGSKTYSSGPILYEDASHINMFQGTRIGT